MLGAVQRENSSEQSPPWSRKASPRTALASMALRSRISPANTSGGSRERVRTISSYRSRSGQFGCCRAV